jgi:RNA polymerase sigma factor (sigma-70 family)
MMRPQSLTDEALAVRARGGDERAFEELVRRYWRVMRAAMRRPGFAMGWEDEGQEALLGLFHACRSYRPERGRFGPLAAVCVRNRISNARTRGRLPGHRIVSEAFGLDYQLGPDGRPLRERLPAGEQADPAVIVEWREELARLATEGERRPEPRRAAPKRPDAGYSDSDVRTALALLADGKSQREAAAAIGASHSTVSRWLNRAA